MKENAHSKGQKLVVCNVSVAKAAEMAARPKQAEKYSFGPKRIPAWKRSLRSEDRILSPNNALANANLSPKKWRSVSITRIPAGKLVRIFAELLELPRRVPDELCATQQLALYVRSWK